MELNYFDLAVVCILALFSLRGFVRGFVGEVAGLVAIVGGLWLAHRYYTQLAPYLSFVGDPMWRNIAAYVLVFLAVLLGVGIVARILRSILAFSFVAWADKLAGFILGLLKGLVICSLMLMLMQRFLGDALFLRDSRILPYLNAVMEQVRSHLPADMVHKFKI